MNITDLAKEPQLVELTINEDNLIEKYGEPIKFHIYDRQPLDVFAKLSTASEGANEEIVKVVEKMILDKDGNEVLVDGKTLPMDVLVAAMAGISEVLGK